MTGVFFTVTMGWIWCNNSLKRHFTVWLLEGQHGAMKVNMALTKGNIVPMKSNITSQNATWCCAMLERARWNIVSPCFFSASLQFPNSYRRSVTGIFWLRDLLSNNWIILEVSAAGCVSDTLSLCYQLSWVSALSPFTKYPDTFCVSGTKNLSSLVSRSGSDIWSGILDIAYYLYGMLMFPHLYILGH